jgi:hypothetical protein
MANRDGPSDKGPISQTAPGEIPDALSSPTVRLTGEIVHGAHSTRFQFALFSSPSPPEIVS